MQKDILLPPPVSHLLFTMHKNLNCCQFRSAYPYLRTTSSINISFVSFKKQYSISAPFITVYQGTTSSYINLAFFHHLTSFILFRTLPLTREITVIVSRAGISFKYCRGQKLGITYIHAKLKII